MEGEEEKKIVLNEQGGEVGSGSLHNTNEFETEESQVSPVSELRRGLNKKIQALYESDQADRDVLVETPIDDMDTREKIHERDKKRLQEAYNIWDDIKNIEGADAGVLHNLSFVFQHGESETDFQTALDVSIKAVEEGLPPKVSLVPQATDRLLIEKQRKMGAPLDGLRQKCGTQILRNEDGHLFFPPLDGTMSEEEREMYGIQAGISEKQK